MKVKAVVGAVAGGALVSAGVLAIRSRTPKLHEHCKASCAQMAGHDSRSLGEEEER